MKLIGINKISRKRPDVDGRLGEEQEDYVDAAIEDGRTQNQRVLSPLYIR
jgi:hypothetical protein